MASEKLTEGIEGFSKAIVALEQLLENRLAELEGKSTDHDSSTELFKQFDLDGDGYITREEWAGTDAVFDALDRDGDGAITPDEMAAGIGCAHCLDEDTKNA
jgi:transaldolase